MATPKMRHESGSPGCPPRANSTAVRSAFTLVELIVATTLLLIILGIVLKLTNQTSEVWSRSAARIQAFQEARGGFESMNRKLTQATLKTYYDYYNSEKVARRDVSQSQLASFVPETYDRISDLHFVTGQAGTLLAGSPTPVVSQTHAVFFQAPLGYSVTYSELDNALNACGFFLEFGDDSASVPDHVRNGGTYVPRHRFRLMEMMQSTEQLDLFGLPSTEANAWFVNYAATESRVLAENIIALVILPKLSDRDDAPSSPGAGVTIAPNYQYNSRIPLGASSDPFWSGATPPFPGDSFIAYPETGGTTAASRHHQLPPILRVVMIAIDEPSAIRLQGSSNSLPSAINFGNTALFQDASQLDADIGAVEDICNAVPGNLTGNSLKLNYRVFSTDILMREAKWSKD